MPFKPLSTAVFVAFVFSSSASAGAIFVDNRVTINEYSLAVSTLSTFSPYPGTSVKDLASSFYDTNFSAPFVILAASDPAASGQGNVYAYAPGGAMPVAFSSTQIANPLGLAVDQSNGDVFVGANSGTTIQEFSATGSYDGTLDTGVNIQSLAVDGAGDVFAADNSTGEILEYKAGGSGATVYASDLDGANYYGLTFDASGNLYATYFDGSGGGGIDEITPTGAVSSVYSASNSLPTSLAYDVETSQLYMTFLNSGNGGGGGIEVFSSIGTQNQSESLFTSLSGMPYAITYLTPEPGTIVMLLGGLACLPLLRRRAARN